jgi:hypothetical protein
MALSAKLISIYPTRTQADFLPGGPICLQNDSDSRGDYISAWHHPTLIQPTSAQLAAAVDALPVITVLMWQAKAILSQTHLDTSKVIGPVSGIISSLPAPVTILSATDAIINLSGDAALKEFWTHGSVVMSDNANLKNIADMLGIPNETRYDLFLQAQSLNV